MKALPALIALTFSIVAPDAFAEGDPGCPDYSFKAKCVCTVGGQRFVRESQCLDAEGRNFYENRQLFFRSECGGCDIINPEEGKPRPKKKKRR